MPLDADDYFAPDYVRFAAKVLDENAHVGIVYAYGCLIGDIEGPWLKPSSQEDLIFDEGVPAPSMYRKSLWQEVGGYHEYMYYGREDWDFFLSILEKGYCVHALNETVGIYYRIKKESRSNQALKYEVPLLANLCKNHAMLFNSYPKQVAHMFHRCYLLRKYNQSQEFKISCYITMPVERIRGFVHYIRRFVRYTLGWIKVKDRKKIEENA